MRIQKWEKAINVPKKVKSAEAPQVRPDRKTEIPKKLQQKNKHNTHKREQMFSIKDDREL